MNRKRRNKGFSMIELLAVVAILGVLAGVGVVAVQTHQRNMTRLEWDSVAKELFIAAQNHLTMAETQGYPGISNMSEEPFGTLGTWTDNADANGVYYYVVQDGSITPSQAEDMWKLMLPLGSVDETVRQGSYVIRYRTNPGTVLDVFYWSEKGDRSRYAWNYTDSDYNSLQNLRGESKKGARNTGGKIIGWYGVEDATQNGIAFGPELKAPSITVENGDRLSVEITEPNATKEYQTAGDTPATIKGVSLNLIITGESSGAKAAISVCKPNGATGETASNNNRISAVVDTDESGNPRTRYTVVLDDITGYPVSGGTTVSRQFAKLNDGTEPVAFANETRFIPGENIVVQAVAYSNDVFTNIAMSSEITTNSLFADISTQTPENLYKEQQGETVVPPATDSWKTAMISSFRHLENLDSTISRLDANDTTDNKLDIKNAMQIADLSWSAFKTNNGGTESTKIAVYPADSSATLAGDDCYLPVNPSHSGASGPEQVALTYNGKGILENGTEDITDPNTGVVTVKQLYTSVNHTITGVEVSNAAEAGLFGSLTAQSSISNVDLVDFVIATTGGNAGALAGTLGAGSTVENVLAYNSSDYETKLNTGITVPGGSTTYSYKNIETTDTNKAAGGLVGVVAGGAGSGEDVKISKCAAALYVKSTAGSAGGLMGTAANATITDSYSGGHTKAGKYDVSNVNVTGATSVGGLIGAASGTTEISYCYSTCSASASGAADVYAGGLIGSTTGDTVKANYIYAVGAVSVETSDDTRKAVKGTLVGSGKLAVQVATVGGTTTYQYASTDDLKYGYALDIDIDDLDDVVHSGIDGKGATSGKYIDVVPAPAVVYDATGHKQKQKLDEEGNPVVKKDPDGNPVLDSNGNPVLEYEDTYDYDYFTVVQLHKLEEKYKIAAAEAQSQTYTPVFTADYIAENYPGLSQTHYGDWVKLNLVIDTNLEIFNEERLWAKITIPKDQLPTVVGDTSVISVLVHGDISGNDRVSGTTAVKGIDQEAYLAMLITKNEKDDYEVSLLDDTVIPGIADAVTTPTTEAKLAALEIWIKDIMPTVTSGNPVLEPFTGASGTEEMMLRFRLDDITRLGFGTADRGGHFTELFPRMIPGENISVVVKGALISHEQMNAKYIYKGTDAAEKEETNWKYTPDSTKPDEENALAVRTNSLFADPHKSETDRGVTKVTDGSKVEEGQAAIANIRHLENLDARISGLDYNDTTDALSITSAKQIEDLVWKKTVQVEKKDNTGAVINGTDGKPEMEDKEVGFLANIRDASGVASNDSVVVYPLSGTPSKANCFLPVTPSVLKSVTPATDVGGTATYVFAANTLRYDAQSEQRDANGYAVANTAENHSIYGIVVDLDAGHVGLFGSVGKLSDSDTSGANGNSISNLELIDFEIKTGDGHAGALAGTLRENAGSLATVSNVIAYNTAAFEEDAKKTDGIPTATISSTGTGVSAGSAGGLIGLLEGANPKLQKSAAALVVKSDGGNAGGLIGTANGATLTGCYSGGHTVNGGYYDTTNSTPIYNVTAAEKAGGLIGEASNMGNVSYCYSTCSAKGNIAGGFAGTFAGSNISYCYATGLVTGTDKNLDSVSIIENGKTRTLTIPRDGAFAYTLSLPPTSPAENCMYFGIINERYEEIAKDSNNSTVTVTAPTTENAKTSFFYLAALGSNGTSDGIKELDADAATYEGFVGAVTEWTDALPYDSQLATYYGTGSGTARVPLFNLKSAERLGMTDIVNPLEATATTPADYVYTHYGDWPAPELFVVNKQ